MSEHDILALKQRISDAEIALNVWDLGHESEYWLRYQPLSTCNWCASPEPCQGRECGHPDLATSRPITSHLHDERQATSTLSSKHEAP